ncbi:hypothetical protein GCM10027093_21350 [Paraburkholderia jirisanensis]
MSNVNLASLPKHKALVLARMGGITIGSDNEVMSHHFHDLLQTWVSANCPRAVDQTDEEFGDLVSDIGDAFMAGFNTAYPDVEAAPAKDDYQAGTKVAIDLMQSWSIRGEDHATGVLVMAELFCTFNNLQGDRQRGFGDAIAGYLMLVLQGYGAPSLPEWNVADNFPQWIGEIGDV